MSSTQEILDSFLDLNILVLGDTCLDISQYCDAIGLSLESPTIKCSEIEKEVTFGWAGNIAHNISQLGARSCTLLTRIGQLDADSLNKEESLISGLRILNIDSEEQLNSMQKKTRIWVKNGETNYKLLQINSGDKLSSFSNKTDSWLSTFVYDEYDAIIIADYGHSFTHQTILALQKEIKKVNKQIKIFAMSQSSSIYADWCKFTNCNIVLNRKEAVECCKQLYDEYHSDYANELTDEQLVSDISRRINANCCITLGKKGAIAYNDKNVKYHDAFHVKVNDDIGAGDAFMAAYVLASISKHKPDLDTSLMLANAWAAAKLYDKNATLDDLWSILY